MFIHYAMLPRNHSKSEMFRQFREYHRKKGFAAYYPIWIGNKVYDLDNDNNLIEKEYRVDFKDEER